MATNTKEDPLITLYKRNTVSSRAKLDDKAKEKEKEQQDAQTLGGERSPKQPLRATVRTSCRQTHETAFSISLMKRATSEKDMEAMCRDQLRLNNEKAKANPDTVRPQSETESASGRQSRKRDNGGTDIIRDFCEQLRIEDEKAKANSNKCRPQSRSRSSSRHRYKHGMPINICTDESSPCRGPAWSNRLPLPSTRPVSSASEGRIGRIIYDLIW